MTPTPPPPARTAREIAERLVLAWTTTGDPSKAEKGIYTADAAALTINITEALLAAASSQQEELDRVRGEMAHAEATIAALERANSLYREGMDERNEFKNQARAAEAKAARARADAIEDAAKVADEEAATCRKIASEQTEYGKQYWMVAATTARLIAKDIRDMAVRSW